MLGRNFWLAAAGLSILIYLTFLAMRLYYPSLDFIEVSVVTIGFMATHGQPMYHTLQDAARYSTEYGPLCYLPWAWGMELFGSSLATLKLTLVVMTAGLFAALWSSYRVRLSRMEAFVALGLVACLLPNSLVTLSFRGDLPLAFAAAVALLAAVRLRGLTSVLVFAIAAAVATDIKVTAVCCLIPPFYYLWRRQGAIKALASVVAAAVMAFLPFLLPTISLRNYIALLHAATRHPLSIALFRSNVIELLLCLLPATLLLGTLYANDRQNTLNWLRERRLLVAALAISLLGAVAFASKNGSGPYQLVPCFLSVVYATAAIWRRLSAISPAAGAMRLGFLAYTFALFATLLPMLHGNWHWWVRSRPYLLSVRADLERFAATHPGQTIEMGYNGGVDLLEPDPRTSFVIDLVFRGNPVTVEPSSVADMQLAGLTTPAATINYVRSCKTTAWLMPTGGEPFGLIDAYALNSSWRRGDSHLFSAEFRDAFLSTYTKTATTRFYDVWTCAAPTHTR